MEQILAKIMEKFRLKGETEYFAPYGSGHINTTYLLILKYDANTYKYIVQRINDNVFRDVDKLMSNIAAVLDHLSEKGGRNLSYVKTASGASYWADASGFYRVYDFIDDCTTSQIVDDAALFLRAGRAFADFQNKLRDFDASRLYAVIADFHNTRKRFENFRASLKKDKCGRAAGAKREIAFVNEREGYSDVFVRLTESGALPLRVTHNDTKINNVLFDNRGVEDVVIDLDTVMPGVTGYDFGDSIRSGCNTAAEDEPDVGKVHFDLELFKSFAEGYLKTSGDITATELETLAFSAILMTYECGMRFLTDYLDGDIYFKTARPLHNLERARTQFKLVSEMEGVLDDMKNIVSGLRSV
ncbi:MAG: aminoglycoside phosphotransferase family protein [Clostridiaceae bacterium]|jgi:Ser/Thr protein kinase RdoA (MazF antagonist)|nr:aminoglycoside phosphotransferase family protein [Clostridiaceae bacterium]